jgi:two-component system, NarL family, response regulator LiaR
MKSPMPTPVPSSGSRIFRILIVDDMPQVRHDLRELFELTKEIIVIGEAINGLDAIQQAEALHPDVVLMDLEMPIMDGCESTYQIKERHLAEKVIILTIHASDEIMQRVRQSGADEYLQKGVSFETMMNAIAR